MMNRSEMRVENELNELSVQFEKLYEKKYGAIYLLKDQKIMICELKQDYVPIEKFKKIFAILGEHIREHKTTKFIFDKRNLRIFHQPSMEWYFLIWKAEMLKEGLSVHRKILPENDLSFKEAVLAGRAQITANNPNNIIDQLDIQYSESIKEAINK